MIVFPYCKVRRYDLLRSPSAHVFPMAVMRREQQQYPTEGRRKEKTHPRPLTNDHSNRPFLSTGRPRQTKKFLSREQDNPERSYRQGRLTAVRRGKRCAGSISRLRVCHVRDLRRLSVFLVRDARCMRSTHRCTQGERRVRKSEPRSFHRWLN